jgi:hypothetical protein
MRIPVEAITALGQFGYTAREAEFLYIVAAHSGFFLQRQFMQFVDVAGRGPATYFLKKALEKKHVREHLPERGTQKIYHLFSRTIYAAIGKENSRHRRPGRYGLLEKAAVRITGLDFVLMHRDHHYFEEESDKVRYFTETQKIPIESLPAKVFRGQDDSETRHCFVENFPISVSSVSLTGIANFTYIEDEIRSLQTFRSFVQRYRPLFETLGERFKLIFVSNSTRSFLSAREVFIRELSGTDRQREQRTLARFFWLRKMAEEKRFKELNHRDVVEWQRGLKTYSEAKFETQYADWRQTGKLPAIVSKSAVHNPNDQFETFLVVPNVGRLSPSAVEEPAQPSAQLGTPEHGTQTT